MNDLRLQAAQFDDIQVTTFDRLIRFAASYENPHPFTVIRASQLFQWIDQGEYQRILNRTDYPGGTTGLLLRKTAGAHIPRTNCIVVNAVPVYRKYPGSSDPD